MDLVTDPVYMANLASYAIDAFLLLFALLLGILIAAFFWGDE